MLPLAFPAYVLAYAYTDFLSHPGPVQTHAAGGDRLGAARLLVPERPLAARRGADADLRLLSLRLPPGAHRLRPAVGLGLSGGADAGAGAVGGVLRGSACRWRGRRSPPGVLLAIMETIADYGTVAYFNVRTFSTGIYQAWFAMQDRAAAAQLALCLLAFALLLAGARARPARAGALAHARRPAGRRWRRSRWRARAAWAAALLCFLPVFVGFLLPVRAPGDAWPSGSGQSLADPRYLRFVGNSLTLAGIAAVVTVAGAVLVGFRARLRPGRGVAGAGAGRRARLRGAGRGDRGRAAGAVRRARQPDRRLGAGSISGSRPGSLFTGTIWLLVARLHGALHGGGAERLRRRAGHRQPADRRGGAHARAARRRRCWRRCTCRS